MAKLTLTDSMMDVVVKMSDGNPGAMNAVMDMIGHGGLIQIMFCDTLGLYGSELYMLWSDCFKKDVKKMLLVLMLVQLGY